MTVQLLMGLIKIRVFIALVVLVCTLAAVSSKERNSDEEVFLRQIVDPASGEIDEDMAALLWISCRQDLIRLKGANEGLDLCCMEDSSSSVNEVNSKSQSLEKENIQKIISVLDPQLERTLLDCLRKISIQFRVSGEEGGPKIWYAKNLESQYPRPDSPRRNLVTESSPAPAPAVGSPNPSPTPSPSPMQVPSSPPDSNSQPPPPVPFFPPASNDSSASPDSNSNVQANKQSASRKPVVIAVVVTASVTFVVAALFFLCCCKVCGRRSGVRRNDERPLLSLSLSDYSVGNSLKEEKLGYHSYGNNSSHHKKASSLDGNYESDIFHSSLHETSSVGAGAAAAKFSPNSFEPSSNVNGQVPPPALKPPPGRVVITSGLPPLKPPPGRADPLPPEPPSSFRPPPSKAGPQPPRPPVPPPSMKASSGAGPHPPGPLLPPPAPPIAPGTKLSPRPPPPPPKSGVPPPRPPPIPLGSKVAQPPLGQKNSSNASSSEEAGLEDDANAPKAKLKPFFWDKVLASPDQSMVWHQIKSGSFQFNEEMIETLFGYNAVDKNRKAHKESSSQDPSPQHIQIIDPKKAQNLAILLRALNVTTEEVQDALHEGNELPPELLQTLLKMAPTAEEELKLRLFNGEIAQLGPAERFLKALVDIPFAFKRMDALLFMCTIQEEATITRESFATLEVACKELRNSRLFLKLLEAVLKTGNRMNDGTFRGGAQAFKLDTLLKLSDVKGTDGKTTLLHFVVQEIIRSEGVRAARVAKESQSFSSIKSDDLLEETSHDTEEHYRSLGLQVVSGLGDELENVKKAAILDADSLIGTVSKLGHQLIKARDFLNSDMKSLGEDSGFHQSLKSFLQKAENDIKWLLEEEKRIMSLVKSTSDYFHGKAGKDEGLRLFVIVRDFLIMLDKSCREVRDAAKRQMKTQKKEAPTAPASSDPRQSPGFHQLLFPAITDRRVDNSSSDEDSP